MTKQVFELLSLLIVLAMLVAACGGASSPTAQPTEPPVPTEAPAAEEEAAEEAAPAEEEEAEEAMVVHQYGQVTATDVGGTDDKGFTQLAWKGMQDASSELGVDVQLLESRQQTDYEKNINEFIGQGYKGIVTVGFLLANATEDASIANPDVPFAIVDKDVFGYESRPDNLLGLTFAVAEPSFMAGYLAAGMSETGIVCTYGGIKIPPVMAFMVGYEHGVAYYNEENGTDVKVLGWKTYAASDGGGDGSFTHNFESLDDGRGFAENFFDEGCDIIMPVAGQVGLGSAAAAQDRGYIVIGVNTDQYVSTTEFQDVYLTSILKNIDVAVFEAVKSMEDGTFEGGINYIGTLTNGGVGLAPFHDFEDAVPQELRDGLAAVEQGLIDGSISTGWPVEAAPAEEAAEGAAAGELGSADNPIQVLFVPSVDAGVIVTGGEVMAGALNEATGLNFEVDVPTSYAATIEAMCASPEDTIGFIPALGYVLANNRCDVEVGAAAVRFGLSWYAAQILVPRDSDIQSIDDLAGKKWAVPDLGSTSGFLYPSVMLQDAGIEASEIVEAGGHGQSVLAVYNGEVDFSTSYFSPPLTDPSWQYGDEPEPYDVNSVIRNDEGRCFSEEIRVLDARCSVTETAPDVFEQTRIMMLSPKIPNDTMSFSPEFPEELKGTIVDALVEFAASDACDESICSDDFYNWSGLDPAEDAFYDPVRNLIDVLGYTEEDVFGN